MRMEPRACIGALLLAFATVWPATATEIQRVRSPGGIEAWLVEDGSVPVISFRFAFRGGAALDPPGKAGLANMVSALIDEGADDLDSQAFQEALDDIVASVGFNAGAGRFYGSLRTLSENRAQAFSLLRKALSAPRFDEEPVDRIRRQIVAGIESAKDIPNQVARRTWRRLVFGAHPFGRLPAGTRQSVEEITDEDLKRFVRERLVRENLTVGVAGDISAKELALRLDEVFGTLPASGTPTDIPRASPAGGRTEIVRQTVPQSIVAFGQAGLNRGHPDYYALYVMNHILGGGRASRLNEELREKRGLVYSVRSYINPLGEIGLIVGQLATANPRVGTALDLVRGEWERMARDGVGEDELEAAKRYINGSFPLRLDSTRSIAGMLVGIQLNELGIDYIDRRPALVDAVTAADIRRVARRLLSPDKLTIVVVGDPEGLETTP